MKRLGCAALLLLVVLVTTACPINHWTARQELSEQGYTEIYFGEVPHEEDQRTWFARRGDDVCSGIIDLAGSPPEVQGRCRPAGGGAGH